MCPWCVLNNGSIVWLLTLLYCLVLLSGCWLLDDAKGKHKPVFTRLIQGKLQPACRAIVWHIRNIFTCSPLIKKLDLERYIDVYGIYFILAFDNHLGWLAGMGTSFANVLLSPLQADTEVIDLKQAPDRVTCIHVCIFSTLNILPSSGHEVYETCSSFSHSQLEKIMSIQYCFTFPPFSSPLPVFSIIPW